MSEIFSPAFVPSAKPAPVASEGAGTRAVLTFPAFRMVDQPAEEEVDVAA